jgi:prephenate dehydratase
VPRIAYFGPSGTFTEMALAMLESSGVFGGVGFTGPVLRISAPSQGAALALIRSGEVDGAVVPIESSIEGSIAPTLDALAVGSRLQIIAETELDVAFTIVARPGVDLSQVRTVAAYPVAAAQVRLWLAERIPQARLYTSASNAAAAEDVAAGKADAAVSTALAGERMGLAVLSAGVADYEGAVTRFVLVAAPREAPPRTGVDRTSLVVLDLPKQPGALMRALDEFATRGVDLTFIESRPTRTGMGTYRFYLDCVGHIDDPAVAEALKALHRTAGAIRYLGSWPAGVLSGCPPPADEPDAAWLAELKRGVADRD